MTPTTGFLLRKIIRLALVLAAAVSLAFGQAKPIPQLLKQGGRFTFMVDGKPFIILGGQVVNDSAFPDRMERAWPKLKAMNCNTVEYPVYWNEIEREEGKFDFATSTRSFAGRAPRACASSCSGSAPGRTEPWIGRRTRSNLMSRASPASSIPAANPFACSRRIPGPPSRPTRRRTWP